MYEMSFGELLTLFVCIFITAKFLTQWYTMPAKKWPSIARQTKYILGALPLVSLIIILFTLKVLASFDVVGDFRYIIMYIALGYAWICASFFVSLLLFDLSWQDDAINLNNQAALFPVCSVFMGSTLIYCGANIGDGPGFWCILFAGGLGMVVWFLLAVCGSLCTKAFYKITVNRDMGCSIRWGAYLLASAIILAKASSGDWISFSVTVIEFLSGWPVLPLTVLAVLVELVYIVRERNGEPEADNNIPVSILLGLVYIGISVAAVLLLPAFSRLAVGLLY